MGEIVMPSNPYPVPRSSNKMTILAWIVTILISTLPDIAWVELAGAVPAWLTFVKMGLLLGLGLATVIYKPLRPLLNYFIVMLAFFGLNELRSRIDFSLPGLQAIFGGTVFDLRMQAEQTGKWVVSLLIISALFILGYKRRDFFLARGDLRTPIDPARFVGFPKPDPWPQFGLQWGFYIASALAVVQYLILRPYSNVFLKMVPVIPSILFYAALNAFNEEITYRASMLATLEQIAGSKQALWMAAYVFGISHYFGTPGGMVGGIVSIFMGWILGKGMVETRGLFWSWWIHLLSDIAIFSFMTLALLK
jgi:hypothetical protein